MQRLRSSTASLRADAPRACVRCLAIARDGSAAHRTTKSILDSMDSLQRGRDIYNNTKGNAYRKSQRLWPSMERYERDLTELAFAPAERLPPTLLPRDVATMQLEGAAVTPEDSALAAAGASAADMAAAEAAHRSVIEEDLSSNDVGTATWQSLGLDTTMCRLAKRRFGPLATRVQSRLLPALLNDDHNDVVLSGVTGSGKTAALLLAALNGVRNESAGMNVVVASNATNARQAHGIVTSLCGAEGGRVVDREPGDMSWLQVADCRDDFEAYYQELRGTLRHSGGAARLLITTPDVLCQLLFERKMEFKSFGFLRRLFVDDVGAQIDLVAPTAEREEVKERYRNPTAAELLLGTLHQVPSAEIRSLLQIAAVSADVETGLKDHLKSLCLKPTRQHIMLVSARLPSTLHCLFSFHPWQQDRYAYLVGLLRNAATTIPGRAAIFIRAEDDALTVRASLRKLGLDARLPYEVQRGGGAWADGWKFVVLKEDECFGVDIPLLSHVFITFTPSTRYSYMHMAGRVGRLGRPGWVYVVADQREAKAVRSVAAEVDVDVVDHTVTQDLRTVPSAVLDSATKELAPCGNDPQYVVDHMYERAEDPLAYDPRRELWRHPSKRDFVLEDYTPVHEKYTAFRNARRLETDLRRAPGLGKELQQRGLLTRGMKSTRELREMLKLKSGRNTPYHFQSLK
jgi:superfamily II DNA/RNA helicase